MCGRGRGGLTTQVGLLVALCGAPCVGEGALGSGRAATAQEPGVCDKAPFRSFAFYVLSRGKGVPPEASEALRKVQELAEADQEAGIAVTVKTTRIGLEGEKRLCFEYRDEGKARRLFDRAKALVEGVDLARVEVETCVEPDEDKKKDEQKKKGAEP